MPENPNFHFPVSLLLQEADAILNAAEGHAAQINARLPQNFVSGARALASDVSAQDVKQKSDAGDVGSLTMEQNAKLDALSAQMTNARETAKRAFKGQDVKLREEFQVGVNKPGDLGSVLQRARIILASLQKAANAAALAGKGWLAADTQALEAAIDALDAADDQQETAKSTKTGTTGGRNTVANQLYESLLTIQNAANLQWPESNSANVSVRAEFRLGKFPPRGGTPPKPEPPKPPTPPA